MLAYRSTAFQPLSEPPGVFLNTKWGLYPHIYPRQIPAFTVRHRMEWDNENTTKPAYLAGYDISIGLYRTALEVDLVASQGFEPRLIGSEPTVLPLNEEATDRAGAAKPLAQGR